MGLLTREALLSLTQTLPSEDVALEGGTVRVRTMTAVERDGFLAAVIDQNRKVDQKAYRTKMLAICVVDESGASMFDEAAWGKANTLLVDKLVEVANRLNTVDDKRVEDVAKNSAPAPSDSSPAASPSSSG
jgi:hypothetical protein